MLLPLAPAPTHWLLCCLLQQHHLTINKQASADGGNSKTSVLFVCLGRMVVVRRATPWLKEQEQLRQLLQPTHPSILCTLRTI